MTATIQIMTEVDTCLDLVMPKLTGAGWGNAPHVFGEQHTFTNGRNIVTGGRVRCGKQKLATPFVELCKAAIWQANAALLLATLARVFAGSA